MCQSLSLLSRSVLDLLAYARKWLGLCTLLRVHQKDLSFFEKFRHARHGSLKPTDALILANVMRQSNPESILEIGSFLGLSTSWLLKVSSVWQAKVTAIDPNIPHRIFSDPRFFCRS